MKWEKAELKPDSVANFGREIRRIKREGKITNLRGERGERGAESDPNYRSHYKGMKGGVQKQGKRKTGTTWKVPRKKSVEVKTQAKGG